MYLKKIELHGFKSFADKVNIEFQPGITGIVGPNGCGKSNISDAVRWVLGEQSVKSLRGSNMADVIFAGSQDRRAQNLAEVTLIFDNSDRMLNYDYNEVEITRRLYRQGNEAEYLLNRQQCRLKDITDLLLDTGLGRDSLSIISQGNISNFADSRPEERRAIFEEAAGVSKYKKRKIEAIRKLERTTDNLNRIKDIVYELEKQIAPLKKQKENKRKPSSSGVVVEGIDNCLVKLSKCCNPLPGDEIIGYITKGRGVSVHRKDCVNVKDLLTEENRIIGVKWYEEAKENYNVTLEVLANDRKGLLVDILNTVKETKANLMGVSTKTTKERIAIMDIDLEVENIEELNKVIRNIKKVDSVYEVRR